MLGPLNTVSSALFDNSQCLLPTHTGRSLLRGSKIPLGLGLLASYTLHSPPFSASQCCSSSFTSTKAIMLCLI